MCHLTSIYIIPTESTLAVPPTCLQGAWQARSLQSKYAAAASSASRVHRWHRACTLKARLSRSWVASNLHLPAAQTVPATHVAGAPPFAARTCLLRSRRRRSARSSYCTLFNNRCVLLRLSKHAPATCIGLRNVLLKNCTYWDETIITMRIIKSMMMMVMVILTRMIMM